MASTSDDSDEAVWKRQLKSPIDPQVRLDPDKWRTKHGRVNKDPRKFEFAIVCKHCSVHRNSLGGYEDTFGLLPQTQAPRSSLWALRTSCQSLADHGTPFKSQGHGERVTLRS